MVYYWHSVLPIKGVWDSFWDFELNHLGKRGQEESFSWFLDSILRGKYESLRFVLPSTIRQQKSGDCFFGLVLHQKGDRNIHFPGFLAKKTILKKHYIIELDYFEVWWIPVNCIAYKSAINSNYHFKGNFNNFQCLSGTCSFIMA